MGIRGRSSIVRKGKEPVAKKQKGASSLCSVRLESGHAVASGYQYMVVGDDLPYDRKAYHARYIAWFKICHAKDIAWSKSCLVCICKHFSITMPNHDTPLPTQSATLDADREANVDTPSPTCQDGDSIGTSNAEGPPKPIQQTQVIFEDGPSQTCDNKETCYDRDIDWIKSCIVCICRHFSITILDDDTLPPTHSTTLDADREANVDTSSLTCQDGDGIDTSNAEGPPYSQSSRFKLFLRMGHLRLVMSKGHSVAGILTGLTVVWCVFAGIFQLPYPMMIHLHQPRMLHLC